MDMHFYWLKDRVAQKQYEVHWRKGAVNLTDYFTKHHSHASCIIDFMRSRYLLDPRAPAPTGTKHTTRTRNKSFVARVC
jgi:hypothetical protein